MCGKLFLSHLGDVIALIVGDLGKNCGTSFRCDVNREVGWEGKPVEHSPGILRDIHPGEVRETAAEPDTDTGDGVVAEGIAGFSDIFRYIREHRKKDL